MSLNVVTPNGCYCEKQAKRLPTRQYSNPAFLGNREMGYGKQETVKRHTMLQRCGKNTHNT